MLLHTPSLESKYKHVTYYYHTCCAFIVFCICDVYKVVMHLRIVLQSDKENPGHK